jgi:hypothetical protein
MAEYETQYQALGTCDDEETDEAPSNDGDFMIHVTHKMILLYHYMITVFRLRV